MGKSWPPDDSISPPKGESFERIGREIRKVKYQLEARDFDTTRVSKALSDMETMKHVSKWALGALFPLLIGGAITLVQSHQRQKILEKQLDDYRNRTAQIETDMNGTRSDVRVMRVKGGTRDEALKDILEALQKFEKEGVTIRRRRRR